MLPNLLTGPEVIVPASQMRWLLTEPETVLSQKKVAREFFEADYTLLNPTLAAQNTVREHILRRHFPRELDGFMGLLVEELNLALAESWGEDLEEWREVSVYSSITDVLNRMVNRVFVGLPLCQSQFWKLFKRFCID